MPPKKPPKMAKPPKDTILEAKLLEKNKKRSLDVMPDVSDSQKVGRLDVSGESGFGEGSVYDNNCEFHYPPFNDGIFKLEVTNPAFMQSMLAGFSLEILHKDELSVNRMNLDWNVKNSDKEIILKDLISNCSTVSFIVPGPRVFENLRSNGSGSDHHPWDTMGCNTLLSSLSVIVAPVIVDHSVVGFDIKRQVHVSIPLKDFFTKNNVFVCDGWSPIPGLVLDQYQIDNKFKSSCDNFTLSEIIRVEDFGKSSPGFQINISSSSGNWNYLDNEVKGFNKTVSLNVDGYIDLTRQFLNFCVPGVGSSPPFWDNASEFEITKFNNSMVTNSRPTAKLIFDVNSRVWPHRYPVPEMCLPKFFIQSGCVVVEYPPFSEKYLDKKFKRISSHLRGLASKTFNTSFFGNAGLNLYLLADGKLCENGRRLFGSSVGEVIISSVKGLSINRKIFDHSSDYLQVDPERPQSLQFNPYQSCHINSTQQGNESVTSFTSDFRPTGHQRLGSGEDSTSRSGISNIVQQQQNRSTDSNLGGSAVANSDSLHSATSLGGTAVFNSQNNSTPADSFVSRQTVPTTVQGISDDVVSDKPITPQLQGDSVHNVQGSAQVQPLGTAQVQPQVTVQAQPRLGFIQNVQGTTQDNSSTSGRDDSSSQGINSSGSIKQSVFSFCQKNIPPRNISFPFEEDTVIMMLPDEQDLLTAPLSNMANHCKGLLAGKSFIRNDDGCITFQEGVISSDWVSTPLLVTPKLLRASLIDHSNDGNVLAGINLLMVNKFFHSFSTNLFSSEPPSLHLKKPAENFFNLRNIVSIPSVTSSTNYQLDNSLCDLMTENGGIQAGSVDMLSKSVMASSITQLSLFEMVIGPDQLQNGLEEVQRLLLAFSWGKSIPKTVCSGDFFNYNRLAQMDKPAPIIIHLIAMLCENVKKAESMFKRRIDEGRHIYPLEIPEHQNSFRLWLLNKCELALYLAQKALKDAVASDSYDVSMLIKGIFSYANIFQLDSSDIFEEFAIFHNKYKSYNLLQAQLKKPIPFAFYSPFLPLQQPPSADDSKSLKKQKSPNTGRSNPSGGVGGSNYSKQKNLGAGSPSSSTSPTLVTLPEKERFFCVDVEASTIPEINFRNLTASWRSAAKGNPALSTLPNFKNRTPCVALHSKGSCNKGVSCPGFHDSKSMILSKTKNLFNAFQSGLRRINDKSLEDKFGLVFRFVDGAPSSGTSNGGGGGKSGGGGGGSGKK